MLWLRALPMFRRRLVVQGGCLAMHAHSRRACMAQAGLQHALPVELPIQLALLSQQAPQCSAATRAQPLHLQAMPSTRLLADAV